MSVPSPVLSVLAAATMNPWLAHWFKSQSYSPNTWLVPLHSGGDAVPLPHTMTGCFRPPWPMGVGW